MTEMLAANGGLLIQGVDFSYESVLNAQPGSQLILQGIDLSVPAEQFVCLLGASGSGKSTLLRLAAGLQTPTRGRLSWRGEEIAAPDLDRGVVFQDYALFPWLSVVDNIEIAIARIKPRVAKAERLAEAREHLCRVGLAAAIGKYPFELSGGMRQRAAIARTLALGSSLLLLDEPFGALDPVNRARLQEVLLDVWQHSTPRKTVVFVTHDIDEALYLGERVVILGAAPGRVIADLSVDFTDRSDRRALFASDAFHESRQRVAETLAEDTLARLVAA
ncbi:ABC transporter ATP-binding protein [Rhodocyclus tenuis]|uniref:ABC transporter ATP-binding protein n=1 Tax=Rhodocyclus tenuis TaxID=1066 RepID=UPI001F5BA126|nr:ABC transporter ATP-binding protein [Rhodocyclus tenuis]